VTTIFGLYRDILLAMEVEKENDTDRYISSCIATAKLIEMTAPTEQGADSMIRKYVHASLWPLLTIALMAVTTPASSQAPTDAQRAAIKSQCRSDYIAHCSSIPPGGAASLQCLQKNMASLSASCQSAVKSVEASVEPKPESKPEPAAETTTAKPAAEPATAAKPDAEPAPAAATKTTAAKPAAGAMQGKPSDAQIAAIRSSCRSEYPRVCAGVPTGGAPALQCLEKNKAKLSSACGQAVAAASGGAAAVGAASTTDANAAPAAAPATPPLVLRQLRPREVIFVMRSACGADVRSLCAGVDPGGGRIIECLATQSASLSPSCRGVLGQFAAR
jgi:hypothetical protein